MRHRFPTAASTALALALTSAAALPAQSFEPPEKVCLSSGSERVAGAIAGYSCDGSGCKYSVRLADGRTLEQIPGAELAKRADCPQSLFAAYSQQFHKSEEVCVDDNGAWVMGTVQLAYDSGAGWGYSVYDEQGSRMYNHLRTDQIRKKADCPAGAASAGTPKASPAAPAAPTPAPAAPAAPTPAPAAPAPDPGPAVAGPADGGVASSTDLQAVLVLHNRWRREYASETGTTLADLQWSGKLEERSRAWAARLHDEQAMYHDPSMFTASAQDPDTGSYYEFAENVSRGSTPAAAAELWYGEKAYYLELVNGGKECKPGLPGVVYNDCGHYKNIVGSYGQLGCAMKGRSLVCRYR